LDRIVKSILQTFLFGPSDLNNEQDLNGSDRMRFNKKNHWNSCYPEADDGYDIYRNSTKQTSGILNTNRLMQYIDQVKQADCISAEHIVIIKKRIEEDFYSDPAVLDLVADKIMELPGFTGDLKKRSTGKYYENKSKKRN